MPTKRKTLRQIKAVLRLKFEAKLSHERIAAATDLSKGAVTSYLKRALEAGIGWLLEPQIDNAALEAWLFPVASAPVAGHTAPDFAPGTPSQPRGAPPCAQAMSGTGTSCRSTPGNSLSTVASTFPPLGQYPGSGGKGDHRYAQK